MVSGHYGIDLFGFCSRRRGATGGERQRSARQVFMARGMANIVLAGTVFSVVLLGSVNLFARSTALTSTGHTITHGSRTPDTGRDIRSHSDAVAAAELVVTALPGTAVMPTLEEMGKPPWVTTSCSTSPTRSRPSSPWPTRTTAVYRRNDCRHIRSAIACMPGSEMPTPVVTAPAPASFRPALSPWHKEGATKRAQRS
jgi:hypothetical protein